MHSTRPTHAYRHAPRLIPQRTSPVNNSVSNSTAHTPDPSLTSLVKQLSEDSSHLVRSELQLFRTEMTEKAKIAGVGAGLLSGAGVIALFGVGALVATAIIALALVLPAWLAALIVTVVLFAAAGIAALLGKRKITQLAPPTPDRTVESVKDSITEIKDSAHR